MKFNEDKMFPLGLSLVIPGIVLYALVLAAIVWSTTE